MRSHSWAATVLVGVVLIAVGCREDGGTGPGGESYPPRLNATAQCLAPPSGMTATGPAFIRSRLASLLLGGDPAREIIAFRRGEVVCFSQEEGRWRLRRTLDPEIVAE